MEETKVKNRYHLPPDPDSTVQNWVEFGGELRMYQIWAITDAEQENDTRVLARMLPHIVRAWSLKTDEGEPLDYTDPDNYGQLTLSQYRALADAASEYISQMADVGN